MVQFSLRQLEVFEAVMRTGARIDTPAEGANVPRDGVIAGIAWAGTRGVSAVELSFDGEHTWQPAQIEAATNELSWRRWRLTAALPAGRRIIAVRAIDGEGMIQDAEPRFPHPSGATGYHRIKVTART